MSHQSLTHFLTAVADYLLPVKKWIIIGLLGSFLVPPILFTMVLFQGAPPFFMFVGFALALFGFNWLAGLLVIIGWFNSTHGVLVTPVQIKGGPFNFAAPKIKPILQLVGPYYMLLWFFFPIVILIISFW